jgi:predicted DCC family thiol-disulfide oxidoreductase YuxK
MGDTGGPVLLYDGVCAFCNGLVRFVLARDTTRRFRFAPLQGETARGMLRKEGKRADDLDTVWLVEPNGTLLARGRAIRAVLRDLDGFWSFIAGTLGFFPAPLLDFLYDAIARRRYRWFGKYESCPVPPAQDRDRFLP